MPLKLYKFRLSPPARLAHLVAELCEANVEYIEVDLSKAEQFSPEFLAVNPKHQVPTLDDNGVNIAQSRDICKHLCTTYINKPEDSHWYPADLAKREEVDHWLDWSKPLHLALEKGTVMAYVGPQAGLPFRENYGIAICIIGALARSDSQTQLELKKQIAIAEEMVGERKIKTVEDLNIGDLATFMEVSLPMECHEDFSWSQYPNLDNLYDVCKKVRHFQTVHKPFLEFCENYRHHRDAGTTASWASLAWQVLVGARTGFRMAWIKIFGF
eukprot:GFUD01007150.1.p1 GENE.GFUD01007150.1~~GFUD01007150.1.p1  ORF type:complete len:270 (+),score=71.93 GFUD01007150.1:56-865(+)